MTPSNQSSPDRYWLFCGHTYYPHGGFDDFYGSFNDIELATARATELEAERQFDWLSIVDIYVRKQVWPRECVIDID